MVLELSEVAGEVALLPGLLLKGPLQLMPLDQALPREVLPEEHLGQVLRLILPPQGLELLLFHSLQFSLAEYFILGLLDLLHFLKVGTEARLRSAMRLPPIALHRLYLVLLLFLLSG